jgi:hypothetical protein
MIIVEIFFLLIINIIDCVDCINIIDYVYCSKSNRLLSFFFLEWK